MANVTYNADSASLPRPLLPEIRPDWMEAVRPRLLEPGFAPASIGIDVFSTQLTD